MKFFLEKYYLEFCVVDTTDRENRGGTVIEIPYAYILE